MEDNAKKVAEILVNTCTYIPYNCDSPYRPCWNFVSGINSRGCPIFGEDVDCNHVTVEMWESFIKGERAALCSFKSERFD